MTAPKKTAKKIPWKIASPSDPVRAKWIDRVALGGALGVRKQGRDPRCSPSVCSNPFGTDQ